VPQCSGSSLAHAAQVPSSHQAKLGQSLFSAQAPQWPVVPPKHLGVSPEQARQSGPQCAAVSQVSQLPVSHHAPSPHSSSFRQLTQVVPSAEQACPSAMQSTQSAPQASDTSQSAQLPLGSQ